MKRKVLAMLVPALLVAGAANAAEIYNKNGNKLDLYGKMVGERILTDRENGEKGDNSQDTSYARVGVKGETQINPELTGYGQFELDLEASNRHNPDQTRLAYAGLSYKDFGSFDYGRNVGVAYDAEAFTDMFVEWGGDSWAGTDLFMTNRTNGVATYRNTDFFGMVEGLNFALQYQGKNEGTGNYKANGDGHGLSVTGFAPIFPDICYHLTHYKPAAADIPVASDNPAHYADAIRYNARTPLQGSLLPLTRLVWA